MSYPGTQYKDVSVFTSDYTALVQEVKASDVLIEGEDYTLSEDGSEVIPVQSFVPIQRDNEKAFMILRLAFEFDHLGNEIGGVNLLTLENLDLWGFYKVEGVDGEMQQLYNFTPEQQAIIDTFSNFEKTVFAGS